MHSPGARMLAPTSINPVAAGADAPRSQPGSQEKTMNRVDTLLPSALEVQVAEMLVATADGADELVDRAVTEVLKVLRERMKMDVVFVSQFVRGRRAFRAVSQARGREVIAAGMSDPLEETWCKRVVDGRLPELIRDAAPLQASGQAPAAPFPIGTHLSTPIVLSNGDVYGTLCCFSFAVSPEMSHRDLQRLRYTAQLVAQKIERARAKAMEADLQPITRSPFTDN
jgi:GAF domain-containing protein